MIQINRIEQSSTAYYYNTNNNNTSNNIVTDIIIENVMIYTKEIKLIENLKTL